MWRCPESLIPQFIGRRGQNLRTLEAGRARITLVNGQICVTWHVVLSLQQIGAAFLSAQLGPEFFAQVSNGTSRRAEWDVMEDIESWLVEHGVPDVPFA